MGSSYIGPLYGYRNVVTTDMGGTSFDIGMVAEGSPRFYQFMPVIDRWLVDATIVDTHSIGAGGGSIARVNELIANRVEVGPESAGSMPGPAAYNQGGHRTDGHRRRRRARLHQPGATSTAARSGSTGTRAERAIERKDRRAARDQHRGGGADGPADRRRRTWARRSGARRCSKGSTRASSSCSRSAGPARRIAADTRGPRRWTRSWCSRSPRRSVRSGPRLWTSCTCTSGRATSTFWTPPRTST